MYTDLTYLQEMLKKDVEERGEQPLTNASLIRAIDRAYEQQALDNKRIEDSFNPKW